jgi:hypothetical protein
MSYKCIQDIHNIIPLTQAYEIHMPGASAEASGHGSSVFIHTLFVTGFFIQVVLGSSLTTRACRALQPKAQRAHAWGAGVPPPAQSPDKIPFVGRDSNPGSERCAESV